MCQGLAADHIDQSGTAGRIQRLGLIREESRNQGYRQDRVLNTQYTRSDK